MRKFRKILLIIMACLPFLPLFGYCLSFIGNDSRNTDFAIGTIEIDSEVYNVTPGSLAESYLENIVPIGEPEYTGISKAIVDLQVSLRDNVGLPVNLVTTSFFWLTFYYGFLIIVDLIMGLIFFVPRKILQIMEVN